MFQAGKNISRLIYQRLLQGIFQILYYIVTFFVYIGEGTKYIISLPYKGVSWVYVHSKKKNVKQQKKKTEPKTKQKNTLSIPFILLAGWQLFIRELKLFILFFIFVGKVLLVLIGKIFRFFFQCIKKCVQMIVFVVTLPYRIFMSLFSMEFRFLLLGFVLCLLCLLVYQSYMFIVNLPSPKEIGKVNYAQSTHLYDRNGRLLYEIYRDQNRTTIPLKEIPNVIKQASIAIEDKDYYHHSGISFLSGILRAMKETVLTKSLQGGSTLTQQLVKSALLSPERTIQRKVKEIILALWTERMFTKDQILEMYLNQVPYGGSSYGIEEASKTYFGKSAKDLTLEEAALLAGLPQAPSLYSPYSNPDLAKARRDEVLKKMKEQGYITEEQKIAAQGTPLTIVPLKTTIKAPHFVFYVKNKLEEEYGIQQVEEGGLKVTTTLDLDIQTEAEKILTEELEKVKSLNVTNGAILVTRPSTGEILAMVGSADYYTVPDGAFNVTTALRQPGSSIKPLMYSLGLEKGFTSASIIDDTPASFGVPGSKPYQPVNYDGSYHGKVPLRYALANSYNIPAVRVLNSVGVDSFVEHARKMGISTWNDSSRFGLSLTLGGGEVHMTDMATAFGVFANRGKKAEASGVLRIAGNKEEQIFELKPGETRVMDPGIAYIMSDILSDNFARRWAFGSNSALEIPGYKVAVKTGTTDEKKDNWTIGYTPEYVVTVWVGNNDNTPMNPYLASGITGAAPIWSRMMQYLLKKNSGNNTWFEKPENVSEKICYFGKKEYFISGTENKTSCRDSLFGVTPTPTKNP